MKGELNLLNHAIFVFLKSPANPNILPLLLFYYIRTYPFPPFAARLGNSFSSTNGDLANTNLTDTDIQQNAASDEFLDSEDGTKDIREWAKAGLSHREMFAYMPTPPTGKYSDMFNPSFVKMVLVSEEYFHLH